MSRLLCLSQSQMVSQPPYLIPSDYCVLTVISANHICAVSIDINGKSMTTSWYNLWADAVAVTGVCVARGKWGVSTISGA